MGSVLTLESGRDDGRATFCRGVAWFWVNEESSLSSSEDDDADGGEAARTR